MPIYLIRLAIVAMINASVFLATTATAQQSQTCAVYFDAVASGNIKVPAVVPDQLLFDSSVAIPCLVNVIKKMAPEIGPRGVTPDIAPRLLSTTAALRSIMTRGAAPGEHGNSPALADFIAKFRAADDLDVASVLSYGARSDIYDLRLNSVLILGNVIDNTTVCVPLAHLNDPGLLDSPNGINGRANLLGVVSVVAPWAYQENFDNIKRTTDAIQETLGSPDTSQKSTSASLANIDARLNSQNIHTNKESSMPKEWRKACADYVENFNPKIINATNVKYND